MIEREKAVALFNTIADKVRELDIEAHEITIRSGRIIIATNPDSQKLINQGLHYQQIFDITPEEMLKGSVLKVSSIKRKCNLHGFCGYELNGNCMAECACHHLEITTE